ncbi:MAG: DUF1353 domain-containing protein [Kiritimatiellae bacterium]|nr:DUF1353 domain-containing protein [Kiritimatiellia bacterium]
MKPQIHAFPDPPPVSPRPDSQWQLTAPYIGPAISGSVTIIIPKFYTDGASIPRFAWRVIGHPLQLPLLSAAILHDAEYCAELHPRATCDRRFLEAMQLLGVNWLKRNTIYAAVRCFGATIWNRHTPATIATARTVAFSIASNKPLYGLDESSPNESSPDESSPRPPSKPSSPAALAPRI